MNGICNYTPRKNLWIVKFWICASGVIHKIGISPLSLWVRSSGRTPIYQRFEIGWNRCHSLISFNLAENLEFFVHLLSKGKSLVSCDGNWHKSTLRIIIYHHNSNPKLFRNLIEFLTVVFEQNVDLFSVRRNIKHPKSMQNFAKLITQTFNTWLRMCASGNSPKVFFLYFVLSPGYSRNKNKPTMSETKADKTKVKTNLDREEHTRNHLSIFVFLFGHTYI